MTTSSLSGVVHRRIDLSLTRTRTDIILCAFVQTSFVGITSVRNGIFDSVYNIAPSLDLPSQYFFHIILT